MKIPITSATTDLQALKAALTTKYPDYKITEKSKKILLVHQSKSIGANIFIGKKNIKVTGTFPTFGGQLLFLLSLLILGIIIGLIIYLIAFHGKFKKLEREIGGFIKNDLSTETNKE